MLIEILSMVLQTVAGFFTMLLLVRAVMRWMRISFINQLGQFVLATTNWVVVPLQRVLPSVGKLDLSCVVPAWAMQVLLVLLLILLSGAGLGNPVKALIGSCVIGFLLLIKSALYLLMGVVLLGVVLSWVNPYAPIAPTVNMLTRPFLAPFRRIIPPLGGVDLSPVVLLLAVQILIFVINALYANFLHLLYA